MAASGGGSGDVLFACTHCHKRVRFEELSTNQQLCKECRKKHPLVTCTYCRLEFHPVRNSANKDNRPACDHCAKDFKQYGTPSFCIVCNLQSAFNSRKCTRCTHSEKKYGSPLPCDLCRMVCAFKKPEEVKQKVDGKTLCLLCTINFKKAQFKKKMQEGKGGKKEGVTLQSKSIKQRDRHKEDESSVRKRPKLEAPFSVESSSSPQPLLVTLGREPQPTIDLISSSHLMETDRLCSEITSLKKQLAQKEQSLIDKDKQICQLKAESMDKEKDIRQKLQMQQKIHSELVDSLQLEIRNLRKQLSQSSKSSSALAKNSAQTAAQAAAQASLAAVLNSSSTS